MKITTLQVGQMAANCYLLTDEKTAKTLIVDPGDDAEYITDKLNEFHGDPLGIVATHGHFDHIMAAGALQLAYDIPFFIHANDEFLVSRMQETAAHFLKVKRVDPPPKTNQIPRRIKVGKSSLDVMHTPGHTPGSVCLYSKKDAFLLTGDTIFAHGGVGRTDFSYSDPEALHASIVAILRLPHGTVLYPGHAEATRVATERKLHSLGII